MEPKKTVLLVDDDQDVLNSMKVALEKDYAVKTAMSGGECLETLSAEKPDLVVLDVMMETLSDGLDTAKKMKEQDTTKEIPIIMLTSVNEHYDYRTQVGEEYFPKDKWLDKPVKPEKLLEEVKSFIG